jgi:2-oxoglutarate ferredoxin oxidoreductase subunit beta
VIDIISPCVTFGNHEESMHSYTFGKEHEEPLHEISFVPARDEITVDDFEEGTTRDVTLHDGSQVILKKLEKEYDPTSRWEALRILEQAQENNWLVTGLIYVNPNQTTMYDMYNMPDMPLNRMTEKQIRPPKETMQQVNDMMF